MSSLRVALFTGLTVLAGAFAASPAQAAVDVGPEQIVVRGDDAQAIITRRPFRLAFRDATGSTVLGEVPNVRPAPFPSPPLPDPQTGVRAAAQPVLYAPLTFTVGGQRAVLDPGTIYTGNVLTNVEGGVQYAASDVLDVKTAGEGVVLTLSTTDPSGRRLVVTVAPAGRGALRVVARPTPDTGVATMADSFVTSAGEAFRGFGGRHNKIDQRGEDLYNWLTETNYSAGPFQPLFTATPGSGGETYLFPNGPTAAFYPQPLFVSSRSYGFLLERDELSRFRMASDRPDAWQTSVAAPALEYVVAPGIAPRAIGALTAITGRHRLPPDWALGPMSTESIQADDLSGDGDGAVARVKQDIADIDKHAIPYTGFDIEAWSFMPRPALKEIIAQLQRRGIVPTLYMTPFLSATADKEEIDKGYAVRTPAGGTYFYSSPFGVLSLWDFTNPAAVTAWKKRVREALDLGADGFMQDWGEQVQLDMHFADGTTGVQTHNRYPVLYHRATRQLADVYERENPGRRIFFYTRTGFTGKPGSAASENANFPGDYQTDWSRSNGIAAITNDMLSRGIGGDYGFTADIGGYLDTYGQTTPELFQRWTQWAALSPMFRIHNNVGAGTKQPWEFDAPTLATYRRYLELRNKALPLIRRLWQEAERTGVPIARPLWLVEPDSAEAARQDQEWMLGDDVLVAPVVVEGATARSVYFPKGCWTAPDTGERHQGPGSATVPAPTGRLPYFVRCGVDPFAAAAKLSKACASRRNFVIRLPRVRRGDRIVVARVLVNGKAVRVLRGRRLRSVVNLRGLPKGRFVVRITGRTRGGRQVSQVRAYRTCAARKRPRT